jgi:hypothetical protein
MRYCGPATCIFRAPHTANAMHVCDWIGGEQSKIPLGYALLTVYPAIQGDEGQAG